jgi:hypothetical protein
VCRAVVPHSTEAGGVMPRKKKAPTEPVREVIPPRIGVVCRHVLSCLVDGYQLRARDLAKEGARLAKPDGTATERIGEVIHMNMIRWMVQAGVVVPVPGRREDPWVAYTLTDVGRAALKRYV